MAPSRATRSSAGVARRGRRRAAAGRGRGRTHRARSGAGASGQGSQHAGKYPAPVLVWMDLEMTGLDPARHVIVEIATIVTDDDLEIVAEGPDLVVHQPREALAEMDDVVRDMHTSSGLLEAIEASTITLEEAGAPDARVHQGARARGPHGAAVRQLDRHRPPLPRRLPPRDRGAPPLPLGRRVDDQGAGPALVPRGARQACPARPRPTAPSTTSARAIAELRFYREHVFRPSRRGRRGAEPVADAGSQLTAGQDRFDRVNDAAPAPRPKRQEQEPASHRGHRGGARLLRSQLPIFLPGLGHVNCYFLEDDRGVAIVDPGLPGPQSWRRPGRPAQAGRLQAQGRPHRRRHPLPPRPLRRGRPLPRPATAPTSSPTAASAPGSTRPTTRRPSTATTTPTTPPGPMPWGRADAVARRRDARCRRCSRRVRFRVMRHAHARASCARRRRPGASTTPRSSRSPGASGCRCTRPATPPTTSACSTPPTASCSPATTCCPRSRRTSRASAPAPTRSTRVLRLARQGRRPRRRAASCCPPTATRSPTSAGRAGEIREHHEERLDTLRAAAGRARLGHRSRSSCSACSSQRSWGPMAESETYAHLEHLRATGEAECRLEHGPLRYRLVD